MYSILTKEIFIDKLIICKQNSFLETSVVVFKEFNDTKQPSDRVSGRSGESTLVVVPIEMRTELSCTVEITPSRSDLILFELEVRPLKY